jgi:hypothetical protein
LEDGLESVIDLSVVNAKKRFAFDNSVPEFYVDDEVFFGRIPVRFKEIDSTTN